MDTQDPPTNPAISLLGSNRFRQRRRCYAATLSRQEGSTTHRLASALVLGTSRPVETLYILTLLKIYLLNLQIPFHDPSFASFHPSLLSCSTLNLSRSSFTKSYRSCSSRPNSLQRCT